MPHIGKTLEAKGVCSVWVPIRYKNNIVIALFITHHHLIIRKTHPHRMYALLII